MRIASIPGIFILLSRRRHKEIVIQFLPPYAIGGNSEVARLVATRLESITAVAYTQLLRQAKAEGSMDKQADEKAFAFCMDSIFLILQFSLSSEYYRDRMKIYMGEDVLSKPGTLIDQVLLFINNALGGRRT